jgi:NADH dehydrogenase
LVAISDRTFQKLLVIDSFKKLLLRTAEIYDTTQEIEHVLAKLPSRCRNGVARDLMVEKVTTLADSATLNEAMNIFQKERHSSYPVVNDAAQVTGLLRRADCFEWLKHNALNPTTPVREMPLKKALFIKPDMPLPEVFETLIRTGASKGLVIDGDQKLLGLLTLYDLMTCPIEEPAAPPVPAPAM